MKRIKFTAILALLYINSIYSQNSLVTFPTPEATELGKYGQVPVSYSNGLPEISIPLYTIQCKDISLPISLSYYAAGNKPDEHPTWVGLGWNLNCGGMITRITNTTPDERTLNDFNRETSQTLTKNPGYYYSNDELMNDDWSDKTCDLLDKLIIANTNTSYLYYGNLDTEPDEYSFNFCGHSGSFYFISENGQIKVKTKSKDGEVINVGVSFFPEEGTVCKIFEKTHKYDETIDQFTIHKTFNKFTVTTRDGYKYEFGGDISSIDFTSETQKKTHPTTWHLTKITSPDGNNITFNYVAGGNNLTQRKSKYKYIVGNPQYSPYNTLASYDNSDVDGLSLVLNHPKYLESINTSTGQSVVFHTSKSVQLDYNNWGTIHTQYPTIFTNILDYLVDHNIDWNNEMSSFNYYLQLNRIEIKNLKNINLFYTNSSSQRLRLTDLSTTPNNVVPTNIADKSNQQKYSFLYNTTFLPDYNSCKTDNWGYYNNKDYSTIQFSNYSTMYDSRSPNLTYCKAEILESLKYPTGGNTTFEYELHDYSQIVSGLDFSATPFSLSNSIGNAGGLRIKCITDYYDANDNTKKTTRTYEYKKLDGSSSSGILSGKPIYYLRNNSLVQLKHCDWNMLLSWSTNTTSIEYAIYSQSQLSPLSNTNGNHITYSRVTESRLDGSKTIYSYTNHDEFPDQVPMDVQTGMKDVLMSAFTSRELERGLLKNIQVYNKSNIVKNIDYNYNDNADRYNDYVKTINQYVLDLNDLLFRYSANKIYTFYPYLKSKVETDYSDDGSTISKTYNYTYNNYNLQSSVTESRSKSNADYKYTTTYPSDINTSPYTLMASNFMLNYPIEQIKYLGTNIVSGKLTTYKAIPTTSNTLFKPDNEYSVKATLPLSSINLFDGTNKDSHYGLPDISFLNYDKVGNLLEIQNKAGFHTTYLWSYNYQYPIAEIKNATYAQVTTALQGITPDQLATSSTPDISTINALRQTLPNTMITNYKYLPFIGTSAIINPRGVTAKYIYDTFNRLYLTQNDDKNILAKNSYGYQNAPDNGQGGYDILSASIQRGANTYEVGTTGSATVTVTGGTGDYTYSWYLINSSGTIVSSSLNGSSAAFNFTPSSAGNLTVRCVVTDNSLGISATVNTTVTYIVSCTFTMKSKYSDLVNNLTLYGSFVTFKLSFTPFANMSLRVNYLVATVCPSCRPSTTQTITCTADGRTWKIYIYSTGEVYWYLSSGSVATAGSTVTVTNLSYNM